MRPFLVLPTALLSILLASTSYAQAPGMTPPPVGVEIVRASKVKLWTTYSGRLAAVDFVEVRPQVSGTIQEIRFQDGQTVRKGDVLAVIDPRPYEAAVSQAEAEFTLARNERKRVEQLVKKQFVSQSQLDQRVSQEQAAAARLKNASINLDRAYIKAPIDGRVSRAELTVGNLVETSMGAPVMTTIASNSGIYADFEVDEATFLQQRYTLENAGRTEKTIPVKMTLRSDSSRLYQGTLEAFDNRINTNSGTVRARARFDNSDGNLLPGMAVTVQMGMVTDAAQVLLSESAISTDQDRKFVLVVDKDNKATYREVKLGASVSGKRVIRSGLNEGDKVIVEGLMKVRPDMVVTPNILKTSDNSPAGDVRRASNDATKSKQ